MIKYIGSKRLLIPKIKAIVMALQEGGTVFDVFSGTSRVGHALKKAGYYVVANDHLTFAYCLARCYVQADRSRLLKDARRVIKELSEVKGFRGYFTETFCIKSRYFQPKNGERIDGIREAIAKMGLEPDLEAIALVSLMEAADRVDSTTGVQMAYLKKWSERSYKDLELRLPPILPGPGLALKMDALEAAPLVEADVAYLDPPYNQHSYLGNYHIWETLVLWDKPETYGVACKRKDCRRYKSPFNSKREALSALSRLVHSVRARHLVVSFNDEGFISREAMEATLRERGYVGVIEVDYKRYVGAQIGIYNPKGEPVGHVSHLRNKEFLYVVSHDRAKVERALEAARGPASLKQLALPF